jgi:hypothetical protein
MSNEQSSLTSSVVTTQAGGNAGTQVIMSSRCVMRPPSYQPGTDLSQYLIMYDRLASANGWTDQQKKNYLIVCFPGGSPLQQACIASPATQSFETLSTELRQMLSAHGDQVKLAEFQQRSKLDSESVGEFERSLRELYFAALGAGAVPDSDPLYLNRFMEGLPQRWKAVIAREMYKRVADSLAHAQRLETAEKLHGSVADQLYSPAWAVPVQTLNSTSTDPRIAQLESKVDTLTTLMQQLLQVQLDQAQRGRLERGWDPGECGSAHQGRPPRRHLSPGAPMRGRSPSGDRTFCRYCRRRGHTVETCWKLQTTQCESCGKRGHTANFCQRQVQSRRGPAAASSSPRRNPNPAGN